MTCSPRKRPGARLIAVAVALASVGAGCNRETPPAAASTQQDEQGTAPAPQAAASPRVDEPAPAPAPQPAAAPAQPSDPCNSICERTERLGCGPRDACLDACAQANAGSICRAEMSAFMGCALTHPAEHWECTDNGVAAIRDGYCETEQQTFVHCFQAAAAAN